FDEPEGNEQHVDLLVVIGERQDDELVLQQPVVDEVFAAGAIGRAALDNLSATPGEVVAQLRQGHLVEHLAGDLDADAAHQIVAEETDAKAHRLRQYIDQRDIAEHIGEIEWIDVAPRRPAARAAARLPISEEAQER